MVKILQNYKKYKGQIFFKILSFKRVLRSFLGKKIFYVIGDSHTLNFLHEAFIIYHIGPATAYKLNFANSTTRSREKVIKILDKIYKNKHINVIFVFGEIDVRIHINKIVHQRNKTLESVVIETVKSYMQFLNYIKEKYPKINIYVFNVLPQGEEENIYKYPFYASLKKRSVIAININKYLKDYSDKNKFKFVSVYDLLIDKYGKRKKEFIFDKVHYNKKIIPYIINQLEIQNR